MHSVQAQKIMEFETMAQYQASRDVSLPTEHIQTRTDKSRRDL